MNVFHSFVRHVLTLFHVFLSFRQMFVCQSCLHLTVQHNKVKPPCIHFKLVFQLFFITLPLVILTARNIYTATTCCMCIFCYFFLSFRQQREQQPDQHHRGANLREPLQLNRNVSKCKKNNNLAATSFVQE